MALGALLVLAPIFWLGTLSYSRYQVKEQTAHAVARLDALQGISATWRVTHDGFFSSQETLLISPTGEPDAPRALIDWQVRYGVLHTRFSGSGDIARADGRSLLAETLASNEQARFSGQISHLDQAGSLEIALPARLQRDTGEHSFHLDAALAALSFDKSRLEAELSFESLLYRGPAGRLAIDGFLLESALALSSELTFTSDGTPEGKSSEGESSEYEALLADNEGVTGRKDRLLIERVRLQQNEGLPLSLRGLDATGATRHVDGELRYLIRAALEGLLISEQALGSAELDAILERLDDQAGAALFETLLSMLQESPETWGDDEGADQPALEHDYDDLIARLSPLAPALFAPLADSPRLRVRTLALESPMFNESLNLSGALTLEGEGIMDTRLETFRTSWGRAAFKRRLDGDFVLHNTPPLLSLVAGQSPGESTLELAIREGVLLINGEPWVLLE